MDIEEVVAAFRAQGMNCQQPPVVLKSLDYEAPINVTVGNVFNGACFVGAFSYLNGASAITSTSIGRYCSISSGVCFSPGQHHIHTLSTHPFMHDPTDNVANLGQYQEYQRILGRQPYFVPPNPARSTAPQGVTVGNDVWIGTRAIILNAVHIGDGAIVAAGAVVTRNVAPYSIVGGVPARVIRRRFEPAIIEQLLELRWWDYDMAHVSNKVDYGKVEAVIDFMKDLIKAGTLPRFVPRRRTLTRTGNDYSLTDC